MHNPFGTFWTFLRWSLEFLYTPPPLFYGTLLLVLNVVVAAYLQKPFGTPLWRQYYSTVILQFLYFPATIAVAATGQRAPTWMENYWGLRAVDAFALASLLTGTYWIWRMKGLRWFAAGLALLQIWILAGAQFIAGMALSGKWL